MQKPVSVLIEAPDDQVINLADCKKALGISGTSQDGPIQAAINAATDELDAAGGGWLGRALREQTWELQLDSFVCERCRRPDRRYHCVARGLSGCEIDLPYPPLLTIVSVKYLDVAGIDQTLVVGAGFRVLRQGELHRKQAIGPVYGGAWPAARCDEASVRIRYTCGYDEDANVMPRNLKSAVCLIVRDIMSAGARDPMLLEDRVEGIGSKRYQTTPGLAEIVRNAASRLLSTLRVY